MPENTRTLLEKSLKNGDKITAIVNRFTHSKSICDKLSNKIQGSQKFVRELSLKYDNNKEYFEQPSYNAAFNNYVTVMENCLNFLEAIEKKALFVRLINGDKYKKTFYRLFIDIDQAVSVLNLGLSVKNQLSVVGNTETLKSSQKEMAMIATRNNGFDDIIADSDQREVILKEINMVQQDKAGNEDILASAEIPQRQIKTIPGLLPRQGRRYTVYKRLYQGNVVAEKTLKESLGDEKLLSDMRKQVAILKQLAVCPYIIQFLGVCIKGNKIGLITDYAEKGNLKDLLESTHRLDKDLKYRFTVDVVEGVAFLHEMGVLHKNIKTSSILITDDYKARISGFEFSREMASGTAIIYDDGSDRYRWIPPEKIQDYFESTNKSDVYSLGMVIWSIWSRRYPYEIMSQHAIEDLVVRGGREDVSQTPFEIRPIITGCWQQDPLERPDASDIVNELDIIANRTGDSEVVPEAMQDPWAHSNFAVTDDSFVTEQSVSDLSAKFDNSSIHDSPSTHKNAWDNYTRSLTSQDSANHSRASSIRSNDIPAPSAPMMEPSHNFQPAKIKTFSSQHDVVPSAPMAISPVTEKPTSGIIETRLAEFDQDTFDADLLTAKRDFHETRLGDFDMDDVEGLELFDAEPVVTIDEALDHHNSGRRKQAFDAFHILIKYDDPKAHYYLGYYYFWGQEDVCEKDWDKALYHFEIASNANDSDALDHLGMYYSNEQNPNKNLVKAFEFYKRSAELGNKKGFYHLGVCYAKGRGTSINKELALANIKEAANRGHSLAIEQLNRSRVR
ncbi:hypothetical protein DSO57_1020868 [Entomophthora muscae]|uniref:Uncharacterized protein n=1 Tax=Entomophthora muscae TaxID=34485 RepID=A0ACC2RIA5_9FUNG|nr:hypothetical protein DSO57_1020868 [Entomophthora muscae]